MRTIIYGDVTDETLDEADLLGGITPTSYVTNDDWTPPLSVLPVDVHPIDRKLGELGRAARNYNLAMNADAAIIVAGCDRDAAQMLRVARQYGLVVYEA